MSLIPIFASPLVNGIVNYLLRTGNLFIHRTNLQTEVINFLMVVH